jgi:hypothetical protein
MIRNKKKWLFVLSVLLLISCKKTFKSREDYIAYIKDEDNGYSQTKEVNGFKVNLTYKPTELMFDDTKMSNEKMDSLKKSYEKVIYFVLSYSKDNKEVLSTISSSRADFNNIQNMLTFRMKEKITLTTENNDTIPMLDYNFARTYGMSRASTMLLVFERSKLLKNKDKLEFNISDIGLGIGDLTFRFNKHIID